MLTELMGMVGWVRASEDRGRDDSRFALYPVGKNSNTVLPQLITS